MTEVFWQSTAKILIGLSRPLGRWERFDKAALGLARVTMQALMATMDSIQLHQIALKSRVLSEIPKALMSSQYFSGMSRPDTSHIIHEVLIWDETESMQCMRALIDCSGTSIFMPLRLRKWLGLADEPAYVTTLGLNLKVMAHESDSRKTAFTVTYMEHLLPVQEWEVLVVPMRAYDLVLGLPWFQSRNPDVDWQHGRLLALQTPGRAEVVVVDWVHLQEWVGNVPWSTCKEEACSEARRGIPSVTNESG